MVLWSRVNGLKSLRGLVVLRIFGVFQSFRRKIRGLNDFLLVLLKVC